MAHLLAVIAAVSLASVLNRRKQIPVILTVSISAVAMFAGFIGARLLDMLEYGRPMIMRDLVRVGPSSIYGAFFLAFPSAIVGALVFRVSPLRLLDGGAPALALGEAMTRIGCFFAGCCYGIPWRGPWAVTFPPASFAFQDQVLQGLILPSAARSLPVHPVQLYSTAIMLGVTLYLVRKFLRPHREGDVFFAFLVAYGALRLLVAPLRVEALASMKVFSVAFIIAGSGGSLAQRRTAPVNPAVRSV